MNREKPILADDLPRKLKLSVLSTVEYESTASCINGKNEILLTIHKPFAESYIYSNGKGNLIPVKSGNLCYASSINDHSEVVGCFGSEFHMMNAYSYKGGKITVLPSLGGSTCAARINNNGLIVGYSTTNEGRRLAVVWKNGKIINIGSKLPGESILYDVNDNGTCIGYITEKKKTDIFYMYKDGSIQIIKGKDECYGIAINSRNCIVGYIRNKDSSNAFRFGDGKFSIPEISRSTGSSANDINNSDIAVGYYIDKSRNQHGFLWKDKKILNLNSLIKSEYNVVNAQSINEMNYIVGQCGFKGKLHACLLCPVG
jgi:probable HAF family extracellular repeat protein